MGNKPITPYFKDDKIITLNGEIHWCDIKHISRDRNNFGCWYDIRYNYGGNIATLQVPVSCGYSEEEYIIKNNSKYRNI